MKAMGIPAYKNEFEPAFHPERLQEPQKRRKPTRIFVCSMGDLFGEWVPKECIQDVLETVKACPRHTFQFLTKNPARYQDFKGWPNNCWLGATVTSSDMMNEAIAGLVLSEAKTTFLSCEPLLGPVRLHEGMGIIWCIIGPMTGPGAMLPRKEWVERLTQDAQAIGAAVFHKKSLLKVDPKFNLREFPGV